jgi:hypothetical protein
MAKGMIPGDYLQNDSFGFVGELKMIIKNAI